jgi:D-alanyl-D-alanine carboxypeptidase
MADSRAPRRPAPRNGRTVGGRRGPFNWQPIFAGAVIAVILSVVVFVAIAADGLQGEPPPAAPGGDVEATPTPVQPAATPTPPAQPTPVPTPSPTPGPDGTIIVACGDIFAPLDKQHRLSADCTPPDLVRLPDEITHGGAQYLRPEALEALLQLIEAARRDGYTLLVNSGYRSFATQAQVHAHWVRVYGQEQADRVSARPGHSEHQLGTAADVGARGLFLGDFVGTPEAAWVQENSWKFGFIVSYPESKEHITGFDHEPWHIRYVGRDVAAEVHRSGLTLREFLHQR